MYILTSDQLSQLQYYIRELDSCNDEKKRTHIACKYRVFLKRVQYLPADAIDKEKFCICKECLREGEVVG